MCNFYKLLLVQLLAARGKVYGMLRDEAFPISLHHLFSKTRLLHIVRNDWTGWEYDVQLTWYVLGVPIPENIRGWYFSSTGLTEILCPSWYFV